LTSFSDVIAIPHALNDSLGAFVEIVTVTGKLSTLKITPEHLIVAGSCGAKSDHTNLVPAGDVAVEGVEAIASVCILKSVGIYTIATMKEYLVVNNFVASPFAFSHSDRKRLASIVRIRMVYYTSSTSSTTSATSNSMYMYSTS
jgi:hypothetical protein